MRACVKYATILPFFSAQHRALLSYIGRQQRSASSLRVVLFRHTANTRCGNEHIVPARRIATTRGPGQGAKRFAALSFRAAPPHATVGAVERPYYE